MLISKQIDFGRADDVQNRHYLIKSQKKQTSHILGLLEKYAIALESVSAIEAALLSEIKGWYTDFSIFSSFISNLEEAVSYKINIITKDLQLLKKAVKEQQRMEYDFYKPFRTSLYDFIDKEKRLGHYTRKIDRLKQSYYVNMLERALPDKQMEHLARNNRKYEVSKEITDASRNKVLKYTNVININRFNRMNPLVEMFTNIQLASSLRCGDKFMKLENYGQILSNTEGDFFNECYFKHNLNKKKQAVRSDNGVRSANYETERNKEEISQSDHKDPRIADLSHHDNRVNELRLSNIETKSRINGRNLLESNLSGENLKGLQGQNYK